MLTQEYRCDNCNELFKPEDVTDEETPLLCSDCTDFRNGFEEDDDIVEGDTWI